MTSNIDEVVSSGLCTRCGACYGICSQDAVRWDENFFPHSNEKCNKCGNCLRVCGGREVDFPRYVMKHYGKPHVLTENAIGPVLYSMACHSTDPEIRRKGASGGIVSQILISLIQNHEIDGALVSGFSPDNPLQPRAVIAKSREDILKCVQSKYTLFPVSHLYSEIAAATGKYAVVGLPCQLHSMFRWMEVNPKLYEKVALIIGLFCHANLEKEALYDLLKIRKILPDNVHLLEFRGGEWPGRIQVVLKNGDTVPLHSGDIKDGAFNYLNKLYIARRCLLCTDFSAELSDIAVSDPWLRDNRGEYMFHGGWSVAHIRTERGQGIIRKMIRDSEITAEEVDSETIIRNNKSLTQYKKRGAFIRLERLKRKGRAFPEYHLQPPAISLMNRLREYLFQVSLAGMYVRLLRQPVLRILFSPLGEGIMLCKKRVKKLKYQFKF